MKKSSVLSVMPDEHPRNGMRGRQIWELGNPVQRYEKIPTHVLVLERSGSSTNSRDSRNHFRNVSIIGIVRNRNLG